MDQEKIEFCPGCFKNDLHESDRWRECNGCQKRFIQVQCVVCEGENFFEQIEPSKIYQCANSCGNTLTLQTCIGCSTQDIIQLDTSLGPYGNNFGTQISCHFCAQEYRLTGCSDCQTVMPIKIDTFTRHFEFKAQLCTCKGLYQMTGCPYCKQVLCFSSAKQSLLKEGFSAQCQPCKKEFGLIKCLKCTQYLKIEDFKNEGAPVACEACSTVNANRLYCKACTTVNSYPDAQVKRYRSGQAVICGNSRCKEKMLKTTNVVTRKLLGEKVTALNGTNYIAERPVQQVATVQQLCEQEYIGESVQVDLQKPYYKSYEPITYIDEPPYLAGAMCNLCGVPVPNLNYLPLLAPCGHQPCCPNCLDQVQGVCPTCQVPIKSIVRDLFKRNLTQEIKEHISLTQQVQGDVVELI